MLLARELAVRRTVDIDLLRATSREAAERDLREAASQDIGDWFRFETGRTTPISDGASGVRIPVTARLGATVWTKFHVDVVAENIRMTGVAEDVPPPVEVTQWMNETKAERSAAEAKVHRMERTPEKAGKDDVMKMVNDLGDIARVLGEAEPWDKVGLYQGLGLRMRYDPVKNSMRGWTFA